VKVDARVPRQFWRLAEMRRGRGETRAARQEIFNRIGYSAGEAASTVVAAAAEALEERGGGAGSHRTDRKIVVHEKLSGLLAAKGRAGGARFLRKQWLEMRVERGGKRI
jgi:hypothetical protein